MTMQPTSVIARDRHEASGNAATNRLRVAWLVGHHEGSTSSELFSASKMIFGEVMDLTEIRRRLTDLKAAKLIHTGPQRYCRIKGNLQLTWFYGRDPNDSEATE